MSVVIVERTSKQRFTGEQLLAFDRKERWCFEAHGVRPKVHCVSVDGLRVCCVLDAPDAEAVRLAGRSTEMVPPDRIWSATILGPVADLSRRPIPKDRALVLVERSFSEPTRFDAIQSVEDSGAWCLSLNRVEFLSSFFSLDGRRMICLYEAPDVDSVRRTNRRIGLPFDRAWGAELYFSRQPA